MTKSYVVDTNILLDTPEILELYPCVILSHVIRELEEHKLSLNSELAYRARKATRYIDENLNSVTFDFKDYQVKFDQFSDPQYTDNKIIQACIENNYGVITNDTLLKHKAKGYEIEVLDIEEKQDDYNGLLETELGDSELANFYENLDFNHFDLLLNQYLIVKNKVGEVVDSYRWNGIKHIQVYNRNIDTIEFGKFKCLDIYQKCAVDSLFNNDVTLIRGKAGSGKSLIALNYAMNQIEKGKFKKLVCLINPMPVKNAQVIGFYKGSKDEKLLQSSIGNLLISKFGDVSVIESLIFEGKLVLIPYSDIRGYDTSDNSIVWVSEAQNLSVDLMKLGLQRVAKGSKIIIDGDDRAQVDSSAFAGNNNGIRKLSKIFRGSNVYGEVEFKNIYRSEIAEIADNM